MNLIEAIKSGRPFRRKSYDASMWLHVAKGTYGCDEVQFMSGDSRFLPFASDLTADDWEIQEPSVTITRSRLEGAIREDWDCYCTKDGVIDFVLRKLGLEPKA